MDDCEKARLKFGHPWSEGAASGFACATVDEYGGTEITRPMAQEPMASPKSAARAAESADKCDPVFVTMNAELVHATMMCDKNYMDTKVGVDVMELAHECDAVLGRTKIRAIMHAAIRDWESRAREKGKDEACAMTEKAFNAVEAAAFPKN